MSLCAKIIRIPLAAIAYPFCLIMTLVIAALILADDYFEEPFEG